MVYFEVSLFLIYLILGSCKKSELADKPIGDKLIKHMILSLSSFLQYSHVSPGPVHHWK